MPLIFRRGLSLLLLIVLLTACDNGGLSKVNSQDLYQDMIELLNEREEFVTTSAVCQVHGEAARIENGYRYYVTFDEPTMAMYDIEALAIEKDVDYSKQMAANIGIFDEKKYSMIPNQVNVKEGYVKGFTISGISENSPVELYLLLQWKSADGGITNSEFIVVNCFYGG